MKPTILIFLFLFCLTGLKAQKCQTPGETKTVELKITPEKLAFYDINMNYTVEPGNFTVKVGTSLRDADLKEIKLTVE